MVNIIKEELLIEETLKEARQNLIEKLRNLSNYCQQLNNNRVQCIQDKLGLSVN